MQRDKLKRHQRIVGLLRQNVISNQDELRTMLEHGGIQVTQATLSRDLKELGVSKTVTNDGLYRYTVAENARELSSLSFRVSGNLVVVSTEVGLAPAVAYQIDDLNLPEVLGTVAGENTLLVVVDEQCDARSVSQSLRERLWTAGS